MPVIKIDENTIEIPQRIDINDTKSKIDELNEQKGKYESYLIQLTEDNRKKEAETQAVIDGITAQLAELTPIITQAEAVGVTPAVVEEAVVDAGITK